MEYCLEMLIFTDLVPLEIVIKKIYIYIFIFIFIYIGHLFVKHDLALICVDRREKEAEKKRGRDRIKEDLFLPHRGFHTSVRICAHMETHSHIHTRTYTHTDTKPDSGYRCYNSLQSLPSAGLFHT